MGDHQHSRARRGGRARAVRSSTASPVASSRLPVGSSASSRRGRTAPARGRRRRAAAGRPTIARDSGRAARRGRDARRARRASRDRNARRAAPAKARLSPTVRLGTRLNCWNTTPSVLRRSAARPSSSSFVTSTSSMWMAPPSAWSSPATRCSSVLLPLPNSPISARLSPACEREVDAAQHGQRPLRRRDRIFAGSITRSSAGDAVSGAGARLTEGTFTQEPLTNDNRGEVRHEGHIGESLSHRPFCLRQLRHKQAALRRRPRQARRSPASRREPAGSTSARTAEKRVRGGSIAALQFDEAQRLQGEERETRRAVGLDWPFGHSFGSADQPA